MKFDPKNIVMMLFYQDSLYPCLSKVKTEAQLKRKSLHKKCLNFAFVLFSLFTRHSISFRTFPFRKMNEKTIFFSLKTMVACGKRVKRKPRMFLNEKQTGHFL